MVSQSTHDIAKDLLTEDVEVFLFNTTSVQYANGYKDIQIHKRGTRETHIDVERKPVAKFAIIAYFIQIVMQLKRKLEWRYLPLEGEGSISIEHQFKLLYIAQILLRIL